MAKCPKAETEGGRFCKVCFPDVVQAKMKQLDRLGDCLQTLAEAQEQFEEKTLEVTTAQLRSWALLCHHIALWVPEDLAGAAGCHEGGESMSPGKTYTLTMDQVDRINEHLGDLGAMIGCLCAGGDRASEFDLGTYAELLEEKFEEFVGDFNEATGQTIEAQKRKK